MKKHSIVTAMLVAVLALGLLAAVPAEAKQKAHHRHHPQKVLFVQTDPTAGNPTIVSGPARERHAPSTAGPTTPAATAPWPGEPRRTRWPRKAHWASPTAAASCSP